MRLLVLSLLLCVPLAASAQPAPEDDPKPSSRKRTATSKRKAVPPKAVEKAEPTPPIAPPAPLVPAAAPAQRPQPRSSDATAGTLLCLALVAGAVLTVVQILRRAGASKRQLSPGEGTTRQSTGDGAAVALRMAQGSAAPARAGRSSRRAEARWVPPGESLTLAGRRIEGGMVYVGTWLPSVANGDAIEPALLVPNAPVGARPNSSGEGMPYWPSYSGQWHSIGPNERAAYLDWLATGRKASSVYIGYVFLFFYGLERRALVDNITEAERILLSAEVARLLERYGANRSFRNYAGRFLGVLNEPLPTSLAELRPEDVTTRELTAAEAKALGCHARDGLPLPADLALRWALTAKEVNLRTPAKRCPAEFLELFRLRYTQTFGTGIIVRPKKEPFQLTYKPASASFGGQVSLPDRGMPQVAITGAGKVQALVEDCTSALEPFSRLVGRGGEAPVNALTAAAVLPHELAQRRQGPELQALRRRLDAQLVAAELAEVPAEELLRSWPTAREGRFTRQDAVMVSQTLEKLGYGIEPDVRFGGPATASGTLVCFRPGPDAPSSPSHAYLTAATVLHLGVAVANAESGIDGAELRQLEEQVESALHLAPAEQKRLRAHLRWLVRSPPNWTAVRKRLADLSDEQKGGLADHVLAVALADGHVSPEELRLLTKIFPALGLREEDVYSRLHQLQATSIDDGPATVSLPGARAVEYAIPGPPAVAPPQAGVRLDQARIAKKLAETAAVSSLLGDIFREADAPPPLSAALPSPELRQPDAERFKGLDAPHSALLALLGVRESWPRAEVDARSSELGLLPDGALELLNEAAWDACGNPLWEGEDPITFDLNVIQELRE